MKVLVLSAVLALTMVFSRTEMHFAPDEHFVAMNDCESFNENEEMPMSALSAVRCQLTQSFPYDSVDCFLDSFRFKLRDELGVDAPAESEIEAVNELDA